MTEAEFWDAVTPYLERDGVITIANLQLALGLPEKEAEEVATHYCRQRKLCRVVTRDSWGYVRIDPNEEIHAMNRCGGVIPHRKR